MFTHIVFFKFTDKSSDVVDGLSKLLKSMEGKVDYLRHLEFGVDVRKTERSYDMALITKFDTLSDLVAYGTHPAHLPVLEFVKQNNIKSNIVDFES